MTAASRVSRGDFTPCSSQNRPQPLDSYDSSDAASAAFYYRKYESDIKKSAAVREALLWRRIMIWRRILQAGWPIDIDGN